MDTKGTGATETAKYTSMVTLAYIIRGICVQLDSISESIRDGMIRGDTDPVMATMFFTASINSVISLAPATGM